MSIKTKAPALSAEVEGTSISIQRFITNVESVRAYKSQRSQCVIQKARWLEDVRNEMYLNECYESQGLLFYKQTKHNNNKKR